MPQSPELRQGEVEPDREQQEDNSKLGQQSQLAPLDHRAWCVWTEEHAHQEVTQYWRGVQTVKHRDHSNRCGEDQKELHQGLVDH